MIHRPAFSGLCFFMILTLFISGCGKNEHSSSIIGTTSGAFMGASISKKHNRATGALLGGLIGNVIGRTIGQEADAKEEEIIHERCERQHAREKALVQRELEQIRSENKALREKWCSICNRQVTLRGANSCPSCGGNLIQERYCRECSATFKPHSGFRYCPYCKHGTKLCFR